MTRFSTPEILNKPIEQLVLFLKSLGFIKIVNFPFPTPPKPDQISEAENRLMRLGAITYKNKVFNLIIISVLFLHF
jgi:ATP-dependent RNA helicase DHX37/DHR1